MLTRRFGGEPATLSQAAAAYGSTRQNVKQVADQLEAGGYLEQRRGERDRRVVRLHLTRKVARFDRPATAARQRALLEKLFSSLTPAEVATLRRLLRGWLESLESPAPAAARRRRSAR